MTRAAALLATFSLLVGCASDLDDGQATQKIRAQLNAEDAAAFSNFLARHHIASAAFCGRPLTSASGQPPRTVGEAIDLARVRDAEELRVRKLASIPKHPRELARQRWDDLISERDLVIDAQSRLTAEHGPAAKRLAEWSALEQRTSHLNEQLFKMKRTVFGPGE
jgi:hypothetical protein